MARKMSVCLLDDMRDMLLHERAMRFRFENVETGRWGKGRVVDDQ